MKIDANSPALPADETVFHPQNSHPLDDCEPGGAGESGEEAIRFGNNVEDATSVFVLWEDFLSGARSDGVI